MSASLEHVLMDECDLSYTNFGQSRWKIVSVIRSDFSQADLTDMEIEHVTLEECRFVATSFFHTKLLGVDFTSSHLESVVFSDNLEELYGVKLSVYQAAALTKNFGVLLEE